MIVEIGHGIMFVFEKDFKEGFCPESHSVAFNLGQHCCKSIIRDEYDCPQRDGYGWLLVFEDPLSCCQAGSVMPCPKDICQTHGKISDILRIQICIFWGFSPH